MNNDMQELKLTVTEAIASIRAAQRAHARDLNEVLIRLALLVLDEAVEEGEETTPMPIDWEEAKERTDALNRESARRMFEASVRERPWGGA